MSRDSTHTRRATPSLPKPQKTYRVCKYFGTPRGCYSQTSCRFLHGEDSKEPPYEQQKLCRYFVNGYCRHGDTCWFRHEDPVVSNATPSCSKSTPNPDVETLGKAQDTPSSDDIEQEGRACGICMETPRQYGLLSGCSHAFCLGCLRNWRAVAGKSDDLLLSNVIKTCPLCRAPSKFITPSSRFFTGDDPKKEEMTRAYKASMSKITCKYIASGGSTKFCPYGNDCFYRHVDAEGHSYQFDHGVDVNMQVHKARRYEIPSQPIRLSNRFGIRANEDQLVAHFIDTAFRSHPTDVMTIFAEFLRNSVADVGESLEDEFDDDADLSDYESPLVSLTGTTNGSPARLPVVTPGNNEPELTTRQQLPTLQRTNNSRLQANFIRPNASSSQQGHSSTRTNEPNHNLPAPLEGDGGLTRLQETYSSQNDEDAGHPLEHRSPTTSPTEPSSTLAVVKEDESRSQDTYRPVPTGSAQTTPFPSYSDSATNASEEVPEDAPQGSSRPATPTEEHTGLTSQHGRDSSLLSMRGRALRNVTVQDQDGEYSCSVM